MKRRGSSPPRLAARGLSSLTLFLAPAPALAQDRAPLALPSFQPAPGGVAPVVSQGGDETRSHALHCLTEAVYYEAATEPREGQEAVAQVVLNRMKNPAFPKSICGVVFEGAERTTGCQFTFTCDGSLGRTPVARRWRISEQVAAEAMDGRVSTRIGDSTHYHAAWMTPYWSHALVETGHIGGHIFYRIPGEAGDGPAESAKLNATVPKGARTSGTRRRAAESTNHVADFSVWGLQVLTVTARRDGLLVTGGS